MTLLFFMTVGNLKNLNLVCYVIGNAGRIIDWEGCFDINSNVGWLGRCGGGVTERLSSEERQKTPASVPWFIYFKVLG